MSKHRLISWQDGACSKEPLFGPGTQLQVGGFEQGSLKLTLGVIKTQQAHTGLHAPDPASQAGGSWAQSCSWLC